eukprot:SAG31_NODE_8665_length_1410_cov_3.434020_2_plen_156_part_00
MVAAAPRSGTTRPTCKYECNPEQYKINIENPVHNKADLLQGQLRLRNRPLHPMTRCANYRATFLKANPGLTLPRATRPAVCLAPANVPPTGSSGVGQAENRPRPAAAAPAGGRSAVGHSQQAPAGSICNRPYRQTHQMVRSCTVAYCSVILSNIK